MALALRVINGQFGRREDIHGKLRTNITISVAVGFWLREIYGLVYPLGAYFMLWEVYMWHNLHIQGTRYSTRSLQSTKLWNLRVSVDCSIFFPWHLELPNTFVIALDRVYFCEWWKSGSFKDPSLSQSHCTHRGENSTRFLQLLDQNLDYWSSIAWHSVLSLLLAVDLLSQPVTICLLKPTGGLIHLLLA